MGSKGNSTCCKVTCITVVAVLLVASLGGNSLLGVWYNRLIPFTVTGVLDLFLDCSYCPPCLACLTGISGEDVSSLCDLFGNTFQCAAQLIYLYGQPDYQQPCYKECNKCQNCLQKTTFGQLGQLTTTLWETVYSNFLATPESNGFTNYTVTCEQNRTGNQNYSCKFTSNGSIRKKRSIESDKCCGTDAAVEPYMTNYNDSHGNVWRPVWFYKPWDIIEPYQAQFYHKVSCITTITACNYNCVLTDVGISFLMTTIEPHASVAEYGYSFTLLTLPNPKVKFISVPNGGYCRCV